MIQTWAELVKLAESEYQNLTEDEIKQHEKARNTIAELTAEVGDVVMIPLAECILRQWYKTCYIMNVDCGETEQ